MFKLRSLRWIAFSLFACSFLLMTVADDAASETVTVRSGNAPIGNPDPLINMLVGPGGAALSAAAFTTGDFAAACGGADAMVIAGHPAWLQQLPCDPQARWIGIDPVGTPASTFYCQNFVVHTCCITSATLDFCWAADDAIGDLIYGGPNPDGVYVNGVAVTPGINGGNYAVASQSGPVDVTPLLHCGDNQLQVYNRDAGFAISGVIYSATFDIVECTVPNEDLSFGQIKSLYR